MMMMGVCVKTSHYFFFVSRVFRSFIPLFFSGGVLLVKKSEEEEEEEFLCTLLVHYYKRTRESGHNYY